MTFDVRVMAKQTARQAHSVNVPIALPPTQRFLPLLLLLFVGSGCAALIYEIVWFQLIQLVIGSSAVSLGVLLGTFMGGMCLGSLLLPRFVSPEQHPLRVYAVLEAGIGVLGLIVLMVVPLVGGAYTATDVHGLAGILLRGVVCAICLLPPTLLMGATLPAIARWVETTPTGVSWLGFFTEATSPAPSLAACLRLLPSSRTRHRHDDGRRRDHQLGCCRCRLCVVEARPTPAGRANTARRVGAANPPVALESRVRRDRVVRAIGARRRGGVDALVVVDAWRVGVHVLDHPCGVSDRSWIWK
jgi:hypothetical protein